ncbi:IS91 family transposase [Sulfidibacter corallicola]|uniref:IS91 family transposase n=1 Tax=Sulfidibacter corallicola TaxID=2818388 RepID=A0A8A4TKE2_SULCO|nr:IS91 family transposase [Sulfidibacter corallicola]QTD49298.1 IS91 family transposase [Sulfidibacter corallicola]
MSGKGPGLLIRSPATARLGDLFAHLGPSFLNAEGLTGAQARVFRDLAQCRTPALGGEIWSCRHCGESVPVYHSCGNRHCPRCGGGARFRWVAQRMDELLPVPYFHLVFTLPEQLNALVQHNPRHTLGLLFRSVRDTLATFAKDPKHLGAEPGILMVLHTWGSKLNLHYHLHCIVTGGGLAPDRSRWIASRSPDYLFPVRAMSPVFRGKYLGGLAKLIHDKQLRFPDACGEGYWERLKSRLYRKPWVVYAKPPFGGPEQVLKYLGRYTHRVAISDKRILSHVNGMVRFVYKDYRQGGRRRVMTLPERDFARRFLDHVLPRGFVRIRYAGLLSHRKKAESLSRCRELLGTPVLQLPQPGTTCPTHPAEIETAEASDPSLDQALGPRTCPECNHVALFFKEPIAWVVVTRARRKWWDTS